MDRKEAIEVLKKYKYAPEVQEALEYLHPELKESEDERIRKWLIRTLKSLNNSPVQIDGAYEMMLPAISWLEKQGEQILANSEKSCKVEPKFKVGDWVIDKQDIVHQIANVVENVTDHTYGYDIVGGGYFNDNTEGVRLWTIEDAKDGDVLVASDGSILLFKCVVDAACKHYIALATDNAVKFNEGLEHYWETSRAVHPATKEQRDLLFQKMGEAGYEWDAEKKELKKIEQESTWNEKIKGLNELETYILSLVPDRSLDAIKIDAKNIRYIINKEQNSAWSEEDEKNLQFAIDDFQFCVDNNQFPVVYNTEKHKEVLALLKSLKERYTWKPSDKQMASITCAVRKMKESACYDSELVSLLNDLKKLKG